MFFYILMSTCLFFAFALHFLAAPSRASPRISFAFPIKALLFPCISLLDVANLHHSNAAQLKTLP